MSIPGSLRLSLSLLLGFLFLFVQGQDSSSSSPDLSLNDTVPRTFYIGQPALITWYGGNGQPVNVSLYDGSENVQIICTNAVNTSCSFVPNIVIQPQDYEIALLQNGTGFSTFAPFKVLPASSSPSSTANPSSTASSATSSPTSTLLALTPPTTAYSIGKSSDVTWSGGNGQPVNISLFTADALAQSICTNAVNFSCPFVPSPSLSTGSYTLEAQQGGSEMSLAIVTIDAAGSSSATPTPSGNGTSPSSGISGGAIAGIVVGVVAALMIVAGLAFFFWRRKRRAARPAGPDMSGNDFGKPELDGQTVIPGSMANDKMTVGAGDHDQAHMGGYAAGKTEADDGHVNNESIVSPATPAGQAELGGQGRPVAEADGVQRYELS